MGLEGGKSWGDVEGRAGGGQEGSVGGIGVVIEGVEGVGGVGGVDGEVVIERGGSEGGQEGG